MPLIIDQYVLSTLARLIINHPKIQTAHAPLGYLGVCLELTQTWPPPAMDCMRLRCAILAASYLMNMFIALTACTDRGTKIWRLIHAQSIFSWALQPEATQKVHRFLMLSDMHMHHLMKGNSGINYRSVIHLLHSNTMPRSWSINQMYCYSM